MILQIELIYRQGGHYDGLECLDIVVNRTDVPLWWRRARPWAVAHLRSPRPSDAATGLYVGVQELQKLITTNRPALNWVEEDELVEAF